jgi:predicted nucleic acid-binding protein
MILIDSYGWIEYLREGPLAKQYSEYFDDLSEIVTPIIVIYEVFKKIKRERGDEQALLVLGQMRKTKIIDITEEITLLAADISIEHDLPMADAFIYAIALSEGVPVVTSNHHFENLDNVVFIK